MCVSQSDGPYTSLENVRLVIQTERDRKTEGIMTQLMLAHRQTDRHTQRRRQTDTDTDRPQTELQYCW